MVDEQVILLKSLGVDVKETMDRFMGNEELFFKCLKKFLADNSFLQLQIAIDENDVEAAFEAAHALKGVSANLGLQCVFEEVASLTEVFRAKSMEYDSGNWRRLKDNYNLALHIIEEL